MKLTKDEARILSEILGRAKYEFVHGPYGRENLYDALTKLEYKLDEACKDERRKGRTSMNDFTDCLKRFVAQYQNRTSK